MSFLIACLDDSTSVPHKGKSLNVKIPGPTLLDTATIRRLSSVGSDARVRGDSDASARRFSGMGVTDPNALVLDLRKGAKQARKLPWSPW